MSPACLLLSLFALSSGSGPALDAQDTGTELPDASQVLAEQRAALGDAERLEGVRNVSFHGKDEWVGLEGKGFATDVVGGLGRFRSTTEFAAFGTFELGASEGLVWEKSPIGVQIRTGWDACQYIRVLGISRNVPWQEMYERARCVGVEDVDGVSCWVLNLVPEAIAPLDDEDEKRVPPPDVWYVERESKLLRRVVARSAGLLGEPVEMVLDYRDWRPVDGILYAFETVVEVSGFTLRTEYESIEHDVELAEDFFEPDEEVLRAIEEETGGARAERDAEIVVETLDERHLASIRLECARADMQKTLAVLLPEVLHHVLAEGAPMEGPPLVRYHSFGDTVDLEAAIPVARAIQPEGRVEASTLPAGPAAHAWHVGPYDEMGEAYERLEAWFAEHDYEPAGAPWEEYWTDPGMEPDPAKWRTRVVWPVRK